jgi:hypothetical protein
LAFGVCPDRAVQPQKVREAFTITNTGGTKYQFQSITYLLVT